MKRLYDLILFDLDGTISDPIIGIGRSINFALGTFGKEELPIECFGKFIGPPLDETFAVLTGSTSGKLIARMVDKYRERFSEIGYSENSIYPGVQDSLTDLHNDGVPMAICTSKRTDYAEKILRMFGINTLFQFVNGGDIGVHKSKQVARLLGDGTISENALMIGDRSVDLCAAHANGLKSAAVLWGYGSREELEVENPSMLFANPQEWQLLKELTRRDSGRR
jgi:phosphoglycolate phosphatase